MAELMQAIESWSDLLLKCSDEQAVIFIRENPELVNTADSISSEYALEQAVFYEKCELVEVLLDLHADVDQVNDQGRLALHTAIELYESSPNVSVFLVGLLLSRGADVETRGHPDFTALHRACLVGSMDIVIALIEHGASLTASSEAWISGGRMPLDIAQAHRHNEIASMLRAKSAESKSDSSADVR